MSGTEGTLFSEILSYQFSELPQGGSRPAIFVDRDGVINQQIAGSYVTRWSEFHFSPGIVEALAEISRLPFPIIVVSNQAGVGKGMLALAELSAITHEFVSQLASAGARIDAAYYCPHTPEQACPCRKPKEGLLLRAARDWCVDLTRSVFVGDSVTDMQAANAVGCRSVLVVGTGTPAIPDIPALVRKALQHDAV